MMYSEDWARSVYGRFVDSSPRAGNILRCVSQVIHETTGRSVSWDSVGAVLIQALRTRQGQPLWRQFRRVVKKEPLDKAGLVKLALMVDTAHFIQLAESQQLLLDY